MLKLRMRYRQQVRSQVKAVFLVLDVVATSVTFA